MIKITDEDSIADASRKKFDEFLEIHGSKIGYDGFVTKLGLAARKILKNEKKIAWSKDLDVFISKTFDIDDQAVEIQFSSAADPRIAAIAENILQKWPDSSPEHQKKTSDNIRAFCEAQASLYAHDPSLAERRALEAIRTARNRAAGMNDDTAVAISGLMTSGTWRKQPNLDIMKNLIVQSAAFALTDPEYYDRFFELLEEIKVVNPDASREYINAASAADFYNTTVGLMSTHLSQDLTQSVYHYYQTDPSAEQKSKNLMNFLFGPKLD